MIAPTPEHRVLNLDAQVLPCRIAAQHICRTSIPRLGEWVEFLVRPGPDFGRMSPLDFVEVGYQRRGLLFDEDIFARCVDAMTAFPASTLFSVNLHPSSLHRDGFVAFIRRELARHGISPGRVILELVEFGGPVNLMASRASLEELRADGVKFALDDFGPGFSNLDLIGSGLVDFVKVDRSLVRFVDTQSGYRNLLSGLRDFARETGVVLVAEGVETAVQAGMLRRLGVEWIQGFYYSRPQLLAAATVRE
jgi:EAL domain-containing protein (putative c-di-GMP-specific phosphodiesterase class I)